MMRRTLCFVRAISLGVAAALIASCGGGGSSSATPPDQPAEGVLLDGQPGGNALAALTDMRPIAASSADIVNGLILTRLDVAITADATVGEVNDALGTVGGGIAGMHAGLPVLVVAVPRQADAASLDALAATLGAQPGIRIVFPGREAVADLAPPGPPANGELALRHLNDARFPAAWNARALAGNCANKPVVLVADFFTRPIPGNSPYTDFPLEVGGVDANGIGGGGTATSAGFHGYDVLTTLAATIDDEVPTGAGPFPACFDIRTVQVAGLSAAGIDIWIAITTSLPGQGKVVINTSLGTFDCSDPCLPSALSARSAGQLAFDAATVRAILAPLADRVLWATAAGNEANNDVAAVYRGMGLAAFTSTFAVAARADADMSFALDESLWEPAGGDCGAPPCFPSLTMTSEQLAALEDHLADLGPGARTPAANILIVGSTSPTSNLRSGFSNPGADVSAVGEGVPTMRKTASQDFETVRGTSVATPQVAGLVAYLWMVSPELRDTRPVSATVSAITGNVAGLASQIDAYASVLSLDAAGDPDPATWPVRRTLLDADQSGKFTETDLAAFIARYFEPPALENPVTPGARDYSRFDLNGDGFTGGNTAAVSFDLDRNGSTQFGAPLLGDVQLQVGGERLDLDERFVSDLEVLCYYAYSPLYEGSIPERERLLANKCFAISVIVTPASRTVAPGDTVAFAAEVRGSADPRVTWSLPDGGGTIDGNGVFTAGQVAGTFTVRATSVADPAKSGTASVTVTGTPAGVARVDNHGFATALVGNVPLNEGCGSALSPPGATTWTDSRSCSSDDGLGNSGSGSATTSFTETYVGDRLVEIVASGSGSGSGVNDGSGLGSSGYQVQFDVLETTQISITALVTAPGFGSAQINLLKGQQFLILDTDGGAVIQTLTLDPGRYALAIEAGTSSNPGNNETESFDLHVTFGP